MPLTGKQCASIISIVFTRNKTAHFFGILMSSFGGMIK